MPRRLGLTVAFALLTSAAQAEVVTSFQLENGLDVVVIEDHRAPVVTHMVWYRAGAADEVPGKSGIAHFLEHLMFKGTDDVGPGELSAIVEAQGGNDIATHFVATTTNVAAAAQFGITTTFGFWDWVGGRYSLWSAIGLPIALAIGAEHFRELLSGAHAMDEHFAHAPAAQNLPLVLGLVDVWYRNFHRFTSRSIAPYHQGLARLPAYLQQLEMESNGKRVDLAGEPLAYGTSPVVWGEPGTNGQHAYFQMLHQGTDVIPVEFVLVKHATHGLMNLHGPLLALLERQHTMLLANGLAQAQALMQGKTSEAALAERAPTASKAIDPATLARHRSFPGNRPSTTLILDQLTPRSLGALIALYEHRVFTSGAVWGINSFDQWGVELGKALCNELLPRLASGDATGLDASTAGLMARLRA